MTSPRRRSRKLTLSVAVTVVAVAAATAACSAGSGDSDADGTSITFATSHPLGDLDPRVLAGDFPGQDLIFEPLIRYGTDGALDPALATEWQVADDGLSVDFTLRSDVTFTDGEPFDADAAVWNFEQWIGKDDYLSIGSSQVIESVDAVDDTHIRLNLSQPYSGLLQELTLVRPVRFASPKSVDDSGTYLGPIGTGPYAIDRNDNQGASFTPNADYWGRKPRFESLTMKIIDDSASRALALRSGEVDVIGGDWLSPISPVEADDLKDADGVELVTDTGFNTLLLGFNFSDGPGSDPAVRRAVAAALDPTVFADVYYRGYAEPAGALYPPNITNAPVPAESPFDPEEAQSILQEAGWEGSAAGRTKDGEPLEFTLVVSDAVLPGARLLSQQVQASLQDVGITVDIATVDASTYVDRVSSGDYDLAFYQTYGAPYDPLSSLTFLFLSTGDRADGRIYESPAVDAGIDAAKSAVGEEATAAAYRSIYDAFDEDSAFVPLVWPKRIWAARTSVGDLTLAPTEYGLPLQLLLEE